MIQAIINNIRQCDDFHNRCDYLLEHDEATHLIEYVTELEETNKRLNEFLKNAAHNYTKYIQERDNKIDSAIKELDRVIIFCENDSQGVYGICNMAIRTYKNIKEILKDGNVDE